MWCWSEGLGYGDGPGIGWRGEGVGGRGALVGWGVDLKGREVGVDCRRIGLERKRWVWKMGALFRGRSGMVNDYCQRAGGCCTCKINYSHFIWGISWKGSGGRYLEGERWSIGWSGRSGVLVGGGEVGHWLEGEWWGVAVLGWFFCDSLL